MQDGSILDDQITASSEYLCYFGPMDARLNHRAAGGTNGSWRAVSNDLNQWIQVDLGVAKMVSGVALQGRDGGNQWVTRYKVQYGKDNNTLVNAVPMDPQDDDEWVRYTCTIILSGITPCCICAYLYRLKCRFK